MLEVVDGCVNGKLKPILIFILYGYAINITVAMLLIKDWPHSYWMYIINTVLIVSFIFIFVYCTILRSYEH